MSGNNWGPPPPQGDPQQPYGQPNQPPPPPYQPPQQPGPYGGAYGQPGGQGQQFPQQPGHPPQQGQYGGQGQQQGQYQYQGSYGQPGMPYPPTPPRRPANRLALWVGVAVIVVAAGVGGFVLLSDDDDKPTTTDVASTGTAKPGTSGGGSTEKAKGGESEEPKLDRPMVFPPAPPTNAGPKFDATKDAATWPKACEMLTDAQIAEVFPGAKVEERKSETTVSAPYDYPGAADNQCSFDLEIPDPASPDMPTYGKIELVLNEVSTPAAAKGHYSEYKRDRQRSPFGVFEDLGTRLNTDDAFRDDAYIMFYKGPYYVQIYITSGLDGPNGEDLPYDDAVKQYGPTLIGHLVARM